MENEIKKQLLKLPHSPGVYLFLDQHERIIYIGKAADLKNRAQSYFYPFKASLKSRQKPDPQNPLKAELVQKTTKIKWQKTDSEIEALILEANLIKKYQPDFNILLKDSSDYFYVGITKETFPKVFITHQITKYKIPNTKYQIPEFIGPFTDGTALKNTIKIIRKVFPFCICRQFHKRPCLNAEIGRCLGICCLLPSLSVKEPNFKEKSKQYRQNITALKKIISGKKKKLILDLSREMKKAAAAENFEKAAIVRNQINNLQKIFSHKKVLFPQRETISWPEINKLIKKLLRAKQDFERIEAYDISHIAGSCAVGAMVVFKKGRAVPENYRRFKIKSAAKQDDPAMLKEIIKRRIYHTDWPLPDLMIIDGGKPQLNVAVNAKIQNPRSKKIKVIALAKDKNHLYLEKRKNPVILTSLPQALQMLITRIRDQAHRFAVKYHRRLRNIKFTA